MPAARYWRLVGIRPFDGGDLELSELHLYDAAGRVDAAATLTCNYAPASGTLAALQDADTATDCRFSSAALRTPSFALTWDFGAGTADVLGVRAAASADAGAFLSMCDLQYFTGTVWATTNLGRHVFPGVRAYTAAPTQVPDFLTPRDVWVQRSAPVVDFGWVASSADGLKLAAADSARYYTSADGGVTWVSRTTGYFFAGAVSGDGGTILCAPYPGNISRSLDGGATRTTLTAAGSRSWEEIACSHNGQTILAVAGDASIFVSTNGGTAFARSLTSNAFNTCAISGDGTKMMVGYGAASTLYTSADSGVNWVARTGAGSRGWSALSISPDGTRYLAAASGYIGLSTDGGVAWTALSGLPTRTWAALTMSVDGQIILAVSSVDAWVSEDSGASWSLVPVNVASLVGGAMSGDGRWRTLVSAVASAMYGYLRRQTLYEPPLLATSATGVDFVAVSAPVGDSQTAPLRGAQTALDAEFGGPCAIAGVTKAKGTPNTPYRSKVRLLRDRDALLVRETWSDPVTGVFVFSGLNPAHKYTAYAQDHMGNFRAVIADRVTPEVPA